jgi:hypothetical protein
MPRLIINVGEHPPYAVELKTGVNYVGRSWSNHIQINHPSVSGRHCEIVFESPTIHVRDLGSTNGIFLNRQPIAEGVLGPGQVLQVGEASIIVEIPHAAQTVTIAIPPLPVPESDEPRFLADGVVACAKHSNTEAVWQCTVCERFFCEACIHQIRRVGGKPLQLCPDCSGHCVEISSTLPKSATKGGLLSFLAKLFRRH